MGTLWDFERYGDSPALIAETGARLTYHDLASLGNDLEHAANGDGSDGTVPIAFFFGICFA